MNSNPNHQTRCPWAGNDTLYIKYHDEESTISNAQAFLKILDEFGSFNHYQWQFVGRKPLQNSWKNLKELPATSKESDLWSKDMKKRGFRFVGSTILYAHMQAVGMVNDHLATCFRHAEVKRKIF